MDLKVSQMAVKPKRIGKLGESDVYETVTKGGLVVLATGNEDGKLTKILGVGPHRAVARQVAVQREPELKVSELTKSEAIVIEANAAILPEYVSLAARMDKQLQK